MAFTFFFRDLDAIEMIPEFVLPGIYGDDPVRIWDAGCANGPEIYSLLMYLKENVNPETFEKLRITASDIDKSNRFRDIIDCGRYKKNELMSVPSHILKKYFTKDEGAEIYTINCEFRGKIVYRKHDLLSLEPVENGFHLIICKHVLQHFSNRQQVSVIMMFYNSLNDGGYLLTEYSQVFPEVCENIFERVIPGRNLFRKKG